MARSNQNPVSAGGEQRAPSLRLGTGVATALVGAGAGSGTLAAGACLVKGSGITDPEDLAYYACFGAADTLLMELVRVAGTRWIPIPDQSKMPSRRPSRRWVWMNTRCAAGPAGTVTSPWSASGGLVHAFLAVIRFYATAADAKGGR